MANIVNIYAESDASVVGDDNSPALTLTNTSTGNALKLTRATAAGNATVALLELAPASTASVAVFSLKNSSFVSAVSLIFATGAGWAGMGAIRVVRTDGTFGWIPVLPDAQVTAAAI